MIGAPLTKDESAKLLHCINRWNDLKRIAAKQCRHCGGALPCWSQFGDVTPGKRR